MTRQAELNVVSDIAQQYKTLADEADSKATKTLRNIVLVVMFGLGTFMLLPSIVAGSEFLASFLTSQTSEQKDIGDLLSHLNASVSEAEGRKTNGRHRYRSLGQEQFRSEYEKT